MEFHTEEIIKLCPYSAIVSLPPIVVHTASFSKIVIVDKGVCTLDINDNAGKILYSVSLKEGDAVIIHSYQPHNYHVDKLKPYSHRDIYLPNELMKEYCEFVKEGLYQEIMSDKIRPFRLSSPSLIYFVERASFLLGKEITPIKDIIRKSLVIDLLSHYVSSVDEEIARPVWINGLLRKIDDESFIILSIKDMVATTNYSHGYVNREFKKYMKCSLKHFVNNRKLELASIMLATSDVSLQEIVIRLSFTTTSSLITLFKEKFGVTPGQFRRSQNAYISLDDYTLWGEPKER